MTDTARGGPILPVTLAIAPWGEVYVDGIMMGVSPPMQSITLPAGTHRIEIRNTTLPSHVEIIEVTGGKSIRIQHKF